MFWFIFVGLARMTCVYGLKLNTMTENMITDNEIKLNRHNIFSHLNVIFS